MATRLTQADKQPASWRVVRIRHAGRATSPALDPDSAQRQPGWVRRYVLPVLPALPLLLASCDTNTPEVHIAASSDLRPVLTSIEQAYERTHQVDLNFHFDSPKTLFKQAQQQPQRFDLFLSSEVRRPKLLKKKLKLASSPFRYAQGQLVLLGMSKQAFFAAREECVIVVERLASGYGYAANHVLEKLRRRLPITAKKDAETARAAFDNKECNAALLPHPGETQEVDWLLQKNLYLPIIHWGIALNSEATTTAFVSWLGSSEAQQALRQHGYLLP